MKVKDLEPNSNADLKVRVCTKGTIREVQSKKGYKLKVCSVLVGDETGTVELSLFGKDIYNFPDYGIVELKDMWVKTWNEKIQISKGRSGTWEKIKDPDFPLTAEIMKE